MIKQLTRPTLKLPLTVGRALDDLKDSLRTLYGDRLRGLVLYGSYARGEADTDSDIDVLILLREPVDPLVESSRLSSLLARLCLKYDVLLATYAIPESWLKERETPLFSNIRREGVTI